MLPPKILKSVSEILQESNNSAIALRKSLRDSQEPLSQDVVGDLSRKKSFPRVQEGDAASTSLEAPVDPANNQNLTEPLPSTETNSSNVATSNTYNKRRSQSNGTLKSPAIEGTTIKLAPKKSSHFRPKTSNSNMVIFENLETFSEANFRIRSDELAAPVAFLEN
jgi:hypothetical protein